jgi:hypothetical protein
MVSFKEMTESMLEDLQQLLQPFADVLPDRRYQHSLYQFVAGMLAARSPQVSPSENLEIFRAVRTLRVVLRGRKVCIVTDAGLDDQKLFAYYERCNLEFITRAACDRLVEVFHERLERWELEHLQDLVDTVPGCIRFKVSFNHAGKVVEAKVTLDWLKIRLPETRQLLWVVIAHSDHFEDPCRSHEYAIEAPKLYSRGSVHLTHTLWVITRVVLLDSWVKTWYNVLRFLQAAKVHGSQERPYG